MDNTSHKKRRKGFGFLKWKQQPALTRCAVCIHVHRISGLPPSMDGRVIVVAWMNKGCEGEQTLPVQATSGGAAIFDEILLHYCKGDALGTFMVRVSLVDAVDCGLGAFGVDLSELASAGNLNSEFGGKAMSFDLEGLGSGGALSVSVYCRMVEEDDSCGSDFGGHKQSKSRCFSCLPSLSCLRSRPDATISGLRVLSLRSDPGFITIENSIKNGFNVDDEEQRFIVIDKGTNHGRGAQRPPSDDEVPCLLMELKEFDVDSMEDQFKCWEGRGEVYMECCCTVVEPIERRHVDTEC